MHQYLADVDEAESWLQEKEPIVTSDDYGKDEDSAQVRQGGEGGDVCVCVYVEGGG